MTISHLAQALALVGTISAGTYAWHDLSTQVANNSRDIAIQTLSYYARLKAQRPLKPDECTAYKLVASKLGVQVSCR